MAGEVGEIEREEVKETREKEREGERRLQGLFRWVKRIREGFVK